jgi:hypothetical protein
MKPQTSLSLFRFLICPAFEVQKLFAPPVVWKVCSWTSCPAQGSVSLRRWEREMLAIRFFGIQWYTL